MSKVFGSTAAGIIIIILMIAVVALVFTMVRLNMKMTRLNRRYRLFMKGADGQTVEKAMAAHMKDLDKLEKYSARHGEDISKLRELYEKSLSRYGIVKYDAFDDVGGKMSFALAMLDTENSGFVLNAIHSRDNCFLYLKEIVKGDSYIMLSDEEIEALRRASGSGDGEV